MDRPTITLINDDCFVELKTLPDDSIDCCITSPPYWGLRNYQVDGQLGLEKTPEEYVAKMVAVFAEVRRVLKPEGTCWIVIGDSYAGGGRGWESCKPGGKQLTNQGVIGVAKSDIPVGLKSKDLCGIPWRIAFALQADGWWLRQDIIWAKPNPMPESVTDRCTKSHEYIFLLTKSASYFYDNEAIKEDSVDEESYAGRRFRGKVAVFASGCVPGSDGNTLLSGGNQILGKKYEKRNKRDVWTVSVETNNTGHYATYPEELIRPCLLAGCPKGGVVLDPFLGSGTTGVVAKQLRLSFIGIELKEDYMKIARRRIDSTEWGMF